jgi:hypothetical protein
VSNLKKEKEHFVLLSSTLTSPSQRQDFQEEISETYESSQNFDTSI